MDVSEASFEERPKGFHQNNKINYSKNNSIATLQGKFLPSILRDNTKRDPSTPNFEHLPSVMEPPPCVPKIIRTQY